MTVRTGRWAPVALALAWASGAVAAPPSPSPLRAPATAPKRVNEEPAPETEQDNPKHKPGPTENVDSEKVPEPARPTSEIWSYFSAGLLLNLWGKPFIDEAEIRDGRVRIQKSSQFAAGVGLQAYYPFKLWTTLRSPDGLEIANLDKQWTRYSEVGVGPYVGVSLATEDVIDTIAVGLAVSVRRSEGGLRFGIGAAFDPDARHLADDFRKNQPVPPNATEIQYVREMAVGGQIMISFTPGFSE